LGEPAEHKQGPRLALEQVESARIHRLQDHPSRRRIHNYHPIYLSKSF
jgi:hypothetical protein